jgi:hypothetical protein
VDFSTPPLLLLLNRLDTSEHEALILSAVPVAVQLDSDTEHVHPVHHTIPADVVVDEGHPLTDDVILHRSYSCSQRTRLLLTLIIRLLLPQVKRRLHLFSEINTQG